MKTPCPRCGNLTHPKGCPARKRSGSKPARRILSFDCETTPEAGIVLFLASGKDRRPDYCYDPNGLSLERVLTWMVRAGADTLNFGFFFDYDVNQLIRLIPDPHKAQLAARGSVYYKGWRIRHIPCKRFSVANTTTGESVTIWDCSGWAQCSFVKLMNDWNLGSEEDRSFVAGMKGKRADLSSETEVDLVRYTTLECALLSEWADTILTLHSDVGIALRAFSGPGSTAAAMVRARGWKPPDIPERVQGVADESFFGGRTEISQIGPIPGPIYSYDINSAYPRAIADLPELAGVRWYRTKDHRPGMWGFYRVRWNQPKRDVWGLFPVRGARLENGKRSVSLLYPVQGEGWFHSIEVDNALRLSPDSVQVVDGWLIEPQGKPFEWIREMAQTRLDYKKAGDMRAFPLKVGLNSIYGKLAQHSGSHPLQCLAYASAVTATARAELLSRAYPNGHNVILLATDGILSRVPLPSCEIGSNLGEWELDVYDSAWTLQAGVYWAGSKCRTRGIDARGLDKAQVQHIWKRKQTNGLLDVPVRRVLSYRLCCAQGKPQKTGTWESSSRSVRFSPEPRRRSFRWVEGRLLTLPARVADYKAQTFFDHIFLGDSDTLTYDEGEANPKWEQPE